MTADRSVLALSVVIITATACFITVIIIQVGLQCLSICFCTYVVTSSFRNFLIGSIVPVLLHVLCALVLFINCHLAESH